jgi:TolB-like protein/class 3 adenylate cyclase
MPAEVKKEIELEIAHVLFLDIVGYSKLSVNEQHARVDELNGIVRLSEQFQKAEAANRILKIPTGDGMALVFYKSPEEPAQCAFEISRALKDNQRLQVRMGIHSGPVSGVVDVNERTNVAGAGINLAQRVMDCGDAGHILLSHHVAEDLAEYERWRPFLHDIGTFEVKHGARVSVTNLYSDEVGNPNLPGKLQAVKKHHAHVRWAAVVIGLLVVTALAAGVLSFLRKGPARSLATAVEKSIAVLPFENLSSDKENAFFTEGVQDEILTHLARIADLKVISRTSVMQYKSGAPRNLREIGQQLGVAHVVEGSVQRAANKVRVIAQLIDAPATTRISGHKPTIAIWPMSSPSKAKSPRPLPISCRRSSRLTRKKPLSSRPLPIWRLSTFTAVRSHFSSRQVSARRAIQTCGKQLNFWMKRSSAIPHFSTPTASSPGRTNNFMD